MATVECPSCRTSNPSEALYCSSCGAPTHHSDGDELIGSTIGGRYHLVEKIGQGSAGILYRAEHVTLRRRMAVKLLHKQLALSEEAIERFRREAITVCEIDNDHIPQVHDFGRTDDEQLFFAMEFLDGETLSAVLEREGRISAERAADILTQIADGLMEAHTLGYVHRDLRPRSIFLTRRRGRQDFVKILDFGLAKLVQPEVDAQRTAMGMTYGDPRYMAPEQARGEAADRRADIYSLGVLGFEMLVGEPPFRGGGTFEVLQKVLDAPVPRLRDRRTDCPPWLESVVRTALAKRAGDRFQTVAQMLDALERKQVLANQPPMPVQLTTQQASKLAGVKEAAPAATRPAPGGAPVQVFVSSPSLRASPVTVDLAEASAGGTQALPTVAPGNRAVAQGNVAHSAPAAAQPATPSPRVTLSYPTSKAVRSGTLPGMQDVKPSPKAEAVPPAAAKPPGSSGELRLLNERLPPVAPKSVPPVQAAPKPASKPSVLIAPTTPPRSDPTPRTARAMLEKEQMAWEEAAMPVLGTTDLTDSARMSDARSRAPSADTPVEAMKFAAGAPSEESPPAAPSSPVLRPISAPAIAAMRSLAPSPVGPKGNEQVKAQPAPAEPSARTPAKQPAASSAVASKSSDQVAASKPAADADRRSAPSNPGVVASDPPIGRTAVPIERPAPAATVSKEPAQVASGAEHAAFGVGPSAGADDDADSADATIPQIRVSARDDATPTIGAAAASTRSPAPAAAVETKAAAASPTTQQAVTTELPKASGQQAPAAAAAASDAAATSAPGAGSENNWFATPVSSANDSYATDEGDVTIGRRPLPKWAVPAGVAGLLLLGVVIISSRSSSRGPDANTPAPNSGQTAPAVVSPANPPTPATPPAAVTPPPPTPAPAEPPAPPSEPPHTEPAAAKAGPQVTPLPVATSLPGPGTEKTAAPKGVEVTPAPVPEVAPMPAKPETAEVKPVGRPEENPVAKAKAEPVSGPGTKKTKPPAEATAKAEPERKAPAKTADAAKKDDAEAGGDKADKPERKPSDAAALVRGGKKKLEDGEPEAAVALFTRAFELDPRSAEAVGGMGEASFEQGNFEAAAKHLSKASKMAPKKALYQELLAQALYKVGRYKDAADACRKLLKQDPGSAKAKQTLELAEKKLGTASDN